MSETPADRWHRACKELNPLFDEVPFKPCPDGAFRYTPSPGLAAFMANFPESAMALLGPVIDREAELAARHILTVPETHACKVVERDGQAWAILVPKDGSAPPEWVNLSERTA